MAQGAARRSRQTRRSRSSPAARWRTSPGSRRRATRCSSAPAGTSSGTGSRGAPPIRVFSAASATSRSTARCGCSGSAASARSAVDADDQGRMRPEALAEALERARRAGDRLRAGRRGEHGRRRPAARDRRRRRAGAGRGCTSTARSASGPPRRRRLAHLVAGVERADSWATDAHKWLNVPYDCGLAFVAHPDAHRAAMRLVAEYLVVDEKETRDAMDWTPEFSRRARGFAVYAALRSLGRSGVAELVERCCRHARTLRRGARAAAGLRDPERGRAEPGAVPLRRRRDDGAPCSRAVQESGEAWMSGTTWDGRAAIRISVSNWRTSDEDVARTVAAFEAACPPEVR